MGPFNNREIATAIWIIIIIVFLLRKADIRKAFVSLLNSFFHFKIILPIIVMAFYSVGSVILLTAIELWDMALLKDTILWFCFCAMAMMMDFVTAVETGNIFKKVLVDNIKIIIFIEFVINTYTFSLPVEIVIVPLIILITVVDVVAKSDEKLSVIAKITTGIQIVIGFAILVIAFWRAYLDWQNLNSQDTFRSIALAPSLSLLLTPLLYIMVLISKYELLFIRLDLGTEKEKRLKRYARRRILMYGRFSLRKLQDLLRNHSADIMHIQSESDVDCFVQQKTK